MKIAINGFGRIGRNFLRTILLDSKAKKEIHVIAINVGPSSLEYVAHMFKYDTLMGTYPGSVLFQDNKLIIDDVSIDIIAQRDPQACNWAVRGVEWVVDASGYFTHRQDASKHLEAGALKVLITAPAKDEDITIIPGINENQYDFKKHHIVSLGSCTTNAFLPIVQVMHNAFGIVNGFMTTVHAYTNTQVLLDVESEDPRRGRAAALNIIPTQTGVSQVLNRVIPSLDGKIKAVSMRVPVAKVSLIDLSFCAQREISVVAICKVLEEAANGRMKGILSVINEPLVSSDFYGSSYSVVIDRLLTDVQGNMGKVFGWYDNEWGYSERLKDFLLFVLNFNQNN